MATDGFASRINGVEYAAVDERRMDSALLMPGPVSAPFSGRSGRRVNGAGLTVSVGGGPEAWTVSPGAGVIYDPAYASQGAWRFEIPSAVSANLPARPGVGQSRIDLIVARIYDPGALGSGLAEVKIERVNGASGASPSAPSLPALSVELGRLLVPASGTITVTQSTRRTVTAGGVLPVATTAERTQLVTDGIAYPGLTIFNEQTKRQEVYGGSGWVAQSQEIDSRSGSAFWGAAYVADAHQYKMHSQTVVGTPNANGNILVADLSAHFAGVGAATATLADSSATQSRGVFCDVAVNLLYVRLFNAEGAFVTASVGAERVNVIIHGWV